MLRLGLGIKFETQIKVMCITGLRSCVLRSCVLRSCVLQDYVTKRLRIETSLK